MRSKEHLSLVSHGQEFSFKPCMARNPAECQLARTTFHTGLHEQAQHFGNDCDQRGFKEKKILAPLSIIGPGASLLMTPLLST